MKKNFHYQDASICYRAYGVGDTIVLLHGFGVDGRIFNRQADALKKHYKVIVPDLPGSGSSGFFDKSKSTAIDDFAECIFALLKHEGVKLCKIMGHSFGGYITLAFAEKYPAMLSGYGLIHSSAAADTTERKNTRRQSIELIRQYGAFAFLEKTIPNLFSDKFPAKNKLEIEMLIKQGQEFSNETLIHYYEAMIDRPERTHVLENTNVPVLFVLGKDDNTAPIDIVLQQVHLPYHSHIHILENVGHMSMIESPELLSNIFVQFMSKNAE